MKVYKCKLLEIKQSHEGARAVIIRLENHEILGDPYNGRTLTSAIEFIDFRRGFMVTQNSIYEWSNP